MSLFLSSAAAPPAPVARPPPPVSPIGTPLRTSHKSLDGGGNTPSSAQRTASGDSQASASAEYQSMLVRLRREHQQQLLSSCPSPRPSPITEHRKKLQLIACPALRRLCDDTYVPTQPWPIDHHVDAPYCAAVVSQLRQFGGFTTVSKLRGFLTSRLLAPDNIKSVPLKAMLAAYPNMFHLNGNHVSLVSVGRPASTAAAGRPLARPASRDFDEHFAAIAENSPFDLDAYGEDDYEVGSDVSELPSRSVSQDVPGPRSFSVGSDHSHPFAPPSAFSPPSGGGRKLPHGHPPPLPPHSPPTRHRASG